MEDSDFPALYKSANDAASTAQKQYFNALRLYLFVLVAAAYSSFKWPQTAHGAILSAVLFLISLGILVLIKLRKPDDTWYNGRAVAESVKTRTWRWMMKAEPYDKATTEVQSQKEFLSDLKAILDQNRSISASLELSPTLGEAITPRMLSVRSMPWQDRLSFYKTARIDDQSRWYSVKSQFNKRRAKQWFTVSIILHLAAVLLLLYRVKEPTAVLPVEVVAAAASAVLTWVNARKYNELNSSYALAAHEIVLIKGEVAAIKDEANLSEFIIDSEAAFSREHTQWTARKSG